MRISDWSSDVCSSDLSEDDLKTLIAFFRARRGPAVGFRLRDPLDDSSAAPGDEPDAADQWLGTGDGIQTRFALVKHYGLSDDPQTRRITRPLSGSVRVSIEGVEPLMGWSLEPGGWISFTAARSEEHPSKLQSLMRISYAVFCFQ